MSKAMFSEPHFQNEEAARALVEGVRWPTGPVCGHCGETERKYATKRPGRWRCGNPACRKDFSVTTGMVMESSHIKLHIWLQAFHLAAASKKGFSAHQLHRELGVTYKTAWFMHHRIMEAMREGGLDLPMMGGEGQIVEVTSFTDNKVRRVKGSFAIMFACCEKSRERFKAFGFIETTKIKLRRKLRQQALSDFVHESPRVMGDSATSRR